MATAEEERLDKLMTASKTRHPRQEKFTGIVEAIRAYLDDFEGVVKLEADQQRIYLRWKEIYKLKMEGKTNVQIVNMLPKLMEVNEQTVRHDLRNFSKVFPPQFDADFEMEVLYSRAQEAYNRLSRSTDPKNQAIAQRYLETMQKCVVWFKENANTPRPQDLKPPIYIITSNPRDIGINSDMPDAAELMRKYQTRKKAKSTEEVEYEDVG